VQRRGGVQYERLLHVHRGQASPLQPWRWPHRGGARRAGQRRRNPVSPSPACGGPSACSCCLHWGEVSWWGANPHGQPHQWHPGSTPQRSWGFVALNLLFIDYVNLQIVRVCSIGI